MHKMPEDIARKQQILFFGKPERGIVFHPDTSGDIAADAVEESTQSLGIT